MSIQRQPNENFKEYKIRLYRNKEIYGLNNEEIGELLNADTGNNWNESAYRKHATAYIEGWDDAIKAGISDDVALAELDKKMDELYKQQVKTRDKLREYRSTLRDEARIENIKDLLIECADIISKEKPLHIHIYPNNSGEKIGVLQISDAHYGEIVDNFLNTYNKEIFNERISKLTSDTIRYCKLMNIGTLKVIQNGDNVSGNIHITSRVQASEDVVAQTMYVAEVFANMLTEFAKHVNQVEFYSVVDNHSRINANKKDHIEKESFSMFIGWYVKARVASIINIKVMDNKINDVDEFGIVVMNIFHEKAFVVHGHSDKLSTMIPDLTMMIKEFPIAVFTGHLHRNFEDEIGGIDLIMSPSAIGVNDYAKDIRKVSKPRQKLTIYENLSGKVERAATFFINL